VSRFALLALVAVIGSGCSALTEGGRLVPRSAVSVKQHSIDLDASLPPPKDQLTVVEPAELSVEAASCSPDDLLIGSAVKSKVARQQAELARQWDRSLQEPSPVASSEISSASAEAIAPACLNRFNSMLSPLPEGSPASPTRVVDGPDVANNTDSIGQQPAGDPLESAGDAAAPALKRDPHQPAHEVFPSAYVSLPEGPAGANVAPAAVSDGSQAMVEALTVINPTAADPLRVNRVCL
jgi:hypothetical protein